MMLLRTPVPNPHLNQSPTFGQVHHGHGRKRKAENQPDNNERLSKRLSLLNLEQNGHRLYVPVENAQRAGADHPSSFYSSTSNTPAAAARPPPSRPTQVDDEWMQVDDTRHKVYIYNIDDELASDSDAEGDGDRVVFLPDIEKHLRANRIPPQILGAPADVDDLADKQLVLYHVPSSISVPEEQDSVRRAILEARERMRGRQKAEREAARMTEEPVGGMRGTDGGSGIVSDASAEDNDPDAMDLD